MRLRELFGSLLVIAFLVIPTIALAGIPTGPPPGPPPTYGVHSFDCNYCHGADMDLSSVADMICLKCHKTGGGSTASAPPAGWPADGYPRDGVTDRGFTGDAASDAMGYNNSATLQTSHNWATPTNYVPAAGAEAPQGAGFQTNYGATGSRIACSTCHLPHEDTNNPQLLALGAGNANAMCIDCHRSWNQGPGNNGVLTHPMVADYTPYSVQAGFKPEPLVNPANATVKLVNGGISCTTCHGVHWVDSDSTTVDGYDQVVNPGDGKLLLADGEQITVNIAGPSTPNGAYPTGGSVCTVCHDYASAFHGNSNNVGCLACHGGHNYNDNNPPVYMLNDTTGSYSSVPADSTAKSTAWVGSSNGVVDGFCETCHGDITTWDSTRTHSTTPPYEDCTQCHGAHSDGSFSEATGCDGCHGSPPSANGPGYNGTLLGAATGSFTSGGYAYANSAGLTPVDAAAEAAYPTPYSYLYSDASTDTLTGIYKNESTTPHATHSGTSSLYNFQCAVCHNTHIDEFNTTHNKGPGSFQDVLQSAYAFIPLTNAGGDLAPGYDNSATLGECSNVYCHSDGGLNNGDGTRTYGAPNVTAQWDNKKDTITALGGATRCQACHGNGATEMVSSTHDTHLNAGFSCNNCHFNTAVDSENLTATAPKTYHVNGTIDVVFDTTNPLKTAGAIVANGPTPYSNSVTMTCTNLYCHSTGQDAVPADRKYKTLDWGTTLPGGATRCVQCHDITTGTDQTAAHAAHINGSTSFVGRDLACATCHDLTMDSGSDDALGTGGLAYHVNGQVDIALPATIDPKTGDCSTALCHSDGNIDLATADINYNAAVWTNPGTYNECDKCHGNDAANKSYPTYTNNADSNLATQDENSHIEHVEDNGFTCEDCHADTSKSGLTADGLNGNDPTKHVNQKIDIAFRRGGNAYNAMVQGETCDATYCHGDSGAGNGPVWGGAALTCDDCHNAGDSLAPTHGVHYNAAANTVTDADFTAANNSSGTVYEFSCGVCHDANQHAKGPADGIQTAEVNFNASIVPDVGGTAAYVNAAVALTDRGFSYTQGLCNNIYCHSDGNNGSPLDSSFVWGGSLDTDCTGCHGNNQTNAPSGEVIVSNSHNAHVNSASMKSCTACHDDTVSDSQTIKSTVLHVNRTKDVDYNSAWADAGTTWNGTSASCRTTYCHSGGRDGSSPFTSSAPNKDPIWENPASINDSNNGQTCSGCHGAKPTGYDAAMTTGAHTAHISDSNQSKLGDVVGCSSCHAATQGSGMTILYNGNHVNQEVNVKFVFESGSNKFAKVNKNATDGTTYGGNPTSALDGATRPAGSTLNAQCNNLYCHSIGNLDGPEGNVVNGPGAEFKAITWDASTTIDCNDCHGNGSVAYPTYASGGANTTTSNSHYNHADIGTSNISCNICHIDTTTDTSGPYNVVVGGKHLNRIEDVNFYNSVVKIPAGEPTYDAGKTCSTTYCHGSGTSPAWGTPGPLACNLCHEASSVLPGSHGAHYNVATVAVGTDRTPANNSSSAKYEFSCGVCHEGAPHATGPVDGDQTAQIIFNAAVAGAGDYTKGGSVAADSKGFNFTNGSCNSLYCHSDGNGGEPLYNTIAWGGAALDCTSCHGSNSSAPSGEVMVSGSHDAHVNSASLMTNKSCETCHDQTVNASDDGIDSKILHVNQAKDVTLLATYNTAGTFTYTQPADTCENVYCHSNGLPSDVSASYKTVTWNTALVGDCSDCHAAEPTTNRHTPHLSDTEYNFGCQQCHNATTSNGTSITGPALHVNTDKDVRFSATYNGGTLYNTTDTSCQTIYCHSDGTALTAPYGTPNTAVLWDTAASGWACDSCHDGGTVSGPNYTNGSPKANSHNAHVVVSGYDCEDCHSRTTSTGTTVTGFGLHVNKAYDVYNSSAADISFTYGGGSCATISCHGNNNATWGDTVSCADCHMSTSDNDDYEDNSTAALISASEWSSVGHGYNATYFNSTTMGGNECLWCHDATVGHETNYSTPTNFFRLRGENYNSGAFGWNGACLVCHDSDETGSYNAESALVTSMDLSTVPKVDKWHQMNAHSLANDNGGQFCWDCHDPHGDLSNIAMIQSYATLNSTTFGAPEVISAGVYNVVGAPINFTDNNLAVGVGGFAINSASLGSFEQGVCNACHTESAASPKMQHYTSTSSDSHNADMLCTNCHNHSANTVNNGSAFEGSGCSGCHGDSGTDRYWPDGSGAHPDDDAGRHLKHMRVVSNSLGFDALTANGTQQVTACAYCHLDYTGGLTGTHADTNIDVTGMKVIWDGSADNATYSNVADTCSNVDCHNAKTAQDLGAGSDFTWKGTDSSTCIMCHNNAPTEQTHAAHLGATIYGLTANDCSNCHDSATNWAANTPPSTDHISGAFSISGDVTLNYNGVYYNSADGTKGSCGVNDCHNDGRNNYQVTGNYDWGTTVNNVTCSFCHTMGSTNAHAGHFAGVGTFYEPASFMFCNDCHTHSGPSTDHMNTWVSMIGSMNYNSTAANLNVASLADYGTCSTTTCHNAGDQTTPVKTPFWNDSVAAADSCAICHFASDSDTIVNGTRTATNSHSEHISSTSVTKYNGAITKGSSTTEYEFSCGNCHGNTLTNHIKGSTNYNATVNSDYSGGSCDANQCHNDGTAAQGAAYNSASWTTGWVDSDGDTCNNCHGNAPATNAHADHDVGIHYDDIYNTAGGLYSDGTNANAHGDDTVSTTISCYSCHNDTVYAKDNRFGSECSSCHGSGGYATTNAVATIGNFNKHVNFSREVVFNASTFRTNAQVRDSIVDSTEIGATWTRYNSSGVENNSGGGYKQAGSYDQAQAALSAGSWDSSSLSCSNIACHNNMVTPQWNTATKGDCMACHTTLPQ